MAADWDGDGKLDLIVGCGDGSVLWYRNVGTREKPVLHAPEVLVRAPNGQPETRDHGVAVKVCVTDWNEDGRLDLLVGDEGERFTKRLNDEERKRRDAARTQQAETFRTWGAIFRDYRTLRAQPSRQSAADRQDREKQLQSKLDELVRLGAQRERSYEDETDLAEGAQTHGRVWAYLRK